ncbi:Uncharacterized protein YqbD [Durusdinium trenchii]|uniref:Uncharacterized protein YqbD n=1 Tax=Durusdinium trenchii TaxID=1381693 RepID=A0ABP0PEN1_9DINO
MTTKKARRRLKNARITHVSLCRRGANGLKTLMKSGGRFQSDMLCSKMDTEGLLHAIVYAPDLPDSEGDAMTADEVKKAAHGFLANGGNIDVEHDLRALGTEAVRIAETLVVQKGDERFAGLTYDGEEVDPTGAWGIILKILDPELRAAYEAGEWDGVSMFGHATVESLGKSAGDEPAPNPETPTGEDSDMTPEQMQEFAKLVAEGVAKAIKPADDNQPAPVQKSQSPDVEFEGDPSNADDVTAHLAKLRVAKVDWNDPKSVAAYQAELAKSQGDGENEDTAELKKQVAALNARIAKAEKASDQPADGAGDDDAETVAKAERMGVSKSEHDQLALGRSIAQRWNATKAVNPRLSPYDRGLKVIRILARAGAPLLLKGLAMAKHDTTGVWEPYSQGGLNELGLMRAFLYEDVQTDATDDVLGVAMIRGELHRDDVNTAALRALMTGSPSEANIDAALRGGTPTLRELGLDVRGLTQVG